MTKTVVSYVVAIAALIGVTGCDMAISEETRQLAQARERTSIQFTASEQWIIFPIPLDGEVTVLAVINRLTGHRILVFSKRSFLQYPQLSADGKHLLVIRANPSSGYGQLLSCATDDWHCRVLVRDAFRIRWPVEARQNVVLYAAARTFDGGKRADYDFYLVKPPSPPIRLSTFELYNLEALTVFGNKVMFSSAASTSLNNTLFPKPSSPLVPHSDIWTLQADWEEKRFIIPPHPLERLYVMERNSTLPIMSADGAHVGFLNGRYPATQSRYRYNLVVARIDGTVVKYVEATTRKHPRPAFQGFSRPAFVGNSVLANQLLEDRYETTLVDLESDSIRQIEIVYHTQSALSVLERREIRIAE